MVFMPASAELIVAEHWPVVSTVDLVVVWVLVSAKVAAPLVTENTTSVPVGALIQFVPSSDYLHGCRDCMRIAYPIAG